MFLIKKLLNYIMYSRMQRRLCPKKYGWYFLSIADCAVQSIQTLVFTWYRWKSIHFIMIIGISPIDKNVYHYNVSRFNSAFG